MNLSENIKFCTGSKFEGIWDLDRTGRGVYTYPSGTQYRGQFKNGLFHGEGIMIFPSKVRILGMFENGKCTNPRLIFSDGLEFKSKRWNYCTPTDRRYQPEIEKGINPVGDSYLTKDRQPRSIPKDNYDVEEGFCELDTGLVTEDFNKEKPLRYLNTEEKAWMMENCREPYLEKLGYNKKIADANLESERGTLACWGDHCFDISWETAGSESSEAGTDFSVKKEESSSSLNSGRINSIFKSTFRYEDDIDWT